MFQHLKLWLRQEAATLCNATFQHLPPISTVTEDDVLDFLGVLAENVGYHAELQHVAIQAWAITGIGHDAPRAYDWQLVLRTLKDQMVSHMSKQFPPEETLRNWRQMDDMLTFAIIEATQLATDLFRADLLEQLENLRTNQEAFEKSKSSFIAVAAHELKTPLTILEGYANMLRAESEEGSRQHIYIEGLGNGFRRMHEVIGDMIDVSLIDLDSVQLKFHEINLEKTILLVADNVDRYFSERRVELTITPFQMDSNTFGDSEKLTNAFKKVLLNALKYTPDFGQVNISAAFIRQDEANENLAGYIDIQITDTGIGIAPENLEKIFTKFSSTADASLHSSSKTKFKGGGPGLGLAIARGIIRGHNGRIWAESLGYDETALPGSTFHIELPIWLSAPHAQ